MSCFKLPLSDLCSAYVLIGMGYWTGSESVAAAGSLWAFLIIHLGAWVSLAADFFSPVALDFSDSAY